jgi:hypothetical protein
MKILLGLYIISPGMNSFPGPTVCQVTMVLLSKRGMSILIQSYPISVVDAGT